MQHELIIPPHQTTPPIETGALENLAARARACGLFLVALQSDGAVAWRDPECGPFFEKIVLPIMRQAATPSSPLGQAHRALDTSGAPALWVVIDGVIAAACPWIERRQMTGTLVLAARGPRFHCGEDLRRFCDSARLDATWISQQATKLPPVEAEALLREARLFMFMARDQVRMGSTVQELDSLSTQLSNSYEELSLIYQVSGGMKVNRGAPDFFKQVCLDVLDVVNVRGMGVYLAGVDERTRSAPSLHGEVELSEDELQRLADTTLGILRQRKSPLMIHDLSLDSRFALTGARQLVAVPLQRQEQVLGCLFALDKRHGDFDSVDLKLLNSIANESAIFLENAVLFQDVRELMMGLLHSLTSAVDAKDAYTCGHSERVALLSRRLCAEAGLTPQLAERVYMAGLLHDVGKIGVPESVLQKTGRLTPAEFEQMKKHPLIGARILSDIKQVEDVIPGVLHHHERYDGRGYPHGLTGQNIPLMGRIICLADCFDAMTSNRTYRRALPLEVALTEIRRYAGTQFDPTLSEFFLRIDVEEFRELLNEHQRGLARAAAVDLTAA